MTALPSHDSSLNYLKITARNVVGLLNRVTSLMRRKRYNLEEVSVSFDENDIAHVILAINNHSNELEQIIRQLYKLHDVMDVYDATPQKDRLQNTFYVKLKKRPIAAKTSQKLRTTDPFPVKPVKVVQDNGQASALFVLSLEESVQLVEFLKKKKYSFTHQSLALTAISEQEKQKYLLLAKKYQQKK